MEMDTLASILNFAVLLGLGVLGLIIKAYLPAYLKKKAENLATKEDIETITTQVESIKHQYSSDLESFKAAIGSRLYIHQTRYQNEFKILLDLSEKLIALRDSALSLRPAMDYANPDESEDERKRIRLNRYHDAAIAAYKIYETRKPFYPEEIYNGIRELDKVVWKEVVQYKSRSDSEGRGFDLEYWEKAEVNAEAIKEIADSIIISIQNRIKSWESFELKE